MRETDKNPNEKFRSKHFPVTNINAIYYNIITPFGNVCKLAVITFFKLFFVAVTYANIMNFPLD